jgi:4-hydroxyphenylpyruvate dioxygenase
MALEPLGIKKLESIHYYVHDLERSRRFYTERLDFAETGKSSAELEARSKQKSLLFEAGDCKVLCSQPAGEGGRAWRFLKKHPDGIGTVIYEVTDIEKCFKLLEERGGTPIQDIERFSNASGTMAMFSITTPFGDTTFRFVERKGYQPLFPGLEMYAAPTGGKNQIGLSHFDHITSNFQTMKPALLWLEHVFGAEKFWDVAFHTSDVTGYKVDKGSGLRSIVMREPHGNIKFANNEPLRPMFKASQINIFNEELRGDGIQHLAIEVKDILSAVKTLRAKGVEFMPTPASYYDLLPARLEKLGVGKLDEDISVLRDLQILVDGERKGEYMLQIFLKDSSNLYKDPGAGPFFYELIQRKGSQGFGAGNFRALFESIEREQTSARR